MEGVCHKNKSTLGEVAEDGLVEDLGREEVEMVCVGQAF